MKMMAACHAVRELAGECDVSDSFLQVKRYVISRIKGGKAAFLALPCLIRKELLRNAFNAHLSQRASQDPDVLLSARYIPLRVGSPGKHNPAELRKLVGKVSLAEIAAKYKATEVQVMRMIDPEINITFRRPTPGVGKREVKLPPEIREATLRQPTVRYSDMTPKNHYHPRRLSAEKKNVRSD